MYYYSKQNNLLTEGEIYQKSYCQHACCQASIQQLLFCSA